eukprot:s3731_g3.t1
MAGGFPAPARPLRPALPAPMLALPAPPSTENHDQEVEIEMPPARSKAGSKPVVQSVSTAKLDAVAPLPDVSKEDQPGVKSTDIEVIQESKVKEIDQKTLDAGPSASALKDAAASKQPDAVEVSAALGQALCDRDASKKKSQGRQRFKLMPHGCGKCCQRPGCCDSRWVDFYAAWAVADEEKKDVPDQEAVYAAWAEAEEQQEAEYYAAWSAAEAMPAAEADVKDEGGENVKEKKESDLTSYKEATDDKATDLHSTWLEMAQPVPGGNSDTEPSSGKDDPDMPECHVQVLGEPLQQAEQVDEPTELDRMIRTLLEQHRSVSGSSAKAVASPPPWTGSPMPPPPKLSSGSAQPAVPTLELGCKSKAMAPGPAHG